MLVICHRYALFFVKFRLMVDPTDKNTKHMRDRSTGTEGYLEYTKEKEKSKVIQLYVGNKKRLIKQW